MMAQAIVKVSEKACEITMLVRGVGIGMRARILLYTSDKEYDEVEVTSICQALSGARTMSPSHLFSPCV